MGENCNPKWEQYEKDMEQYKKDLENWKLNEERNWNLYKAVKSEIDITNQRQANETEKLDKWIMTMAAGSFGLSFAFIDKIIPVSAAYNIPFLIAAWSCFLAVLVIGVTGFITSSIRHSLLADEQCKMLAQRYEGKEPEYKEKSIILDANTLMGYTQILLFIGGSVCLILFIAKNLL